MQLWRANHKAHCRDSNIWVILSIAWYTSPWGGGLVQDCRAQEEEILGRHQSITLQQLGAFSVCIGSSLVVFRGIILMLELVALG